MTQYSTELDKLMQTIFPPQSFEHILGEVAADAGRKQLRMAETEKYAHVTYFLNGGREEPYSGEDRIMVPSPKVATYDLQPEMSAPELTDKAVGAIDSGKYDLIVLNYANPDMVGHTGSLPAAIKAVETVDAGLGRIADAIQKSGGALLVTADHGNCEMMRDPQTGGPHTAHTTNPVPRAAARRPQPRAGGRRPPRRHRADAARADGIAEAEGNDRHVAAARGLAAHLRTPALMPPTISLRFRRDLRRQHPLCGIGIDQRIGVEMRRDDIRPLIEDAMKRIVALESNTATAPRPTRA